MNALGAPELAAQEAQAQRTAPGPLALIAVTFFFVGSLVAVRFLGPLLTLIGVGVTVVLAFLVLAVQNPPKDPAKHVVTLARYARDVLISWLRSPPVTPGPRELATPRTVNRAINSRPHNLFPLTPIFAGGVLG